MMEALKTEEETPASSLTTDLALELMRQHTLLSIMAARMRETASVLQRATRIDGPRLDRALEVHRRYLIEVHEENEARLDRALAAASSPQVRAQLKECAASHPLSQEFHDAARSLRDASPEPAARAARLAALFKAEADRLEQHHEREGEVYRRLDRWLSPGVRRRLLSELRRFDAAHINAEIALISWASQIHASAD